MNFSLPSSSRLGRDIILVKPPCTRGTAVSKLTVERFWP